MPIPSKNALLKPTYYPLFPPTPLPYPNIPNPISQRHTAHTSQHLHFKYPQAINIIAFNTHDSHTYITFGITTLSNNLLFIPIDILPSLHSFQIPPNALFPSNDL